jgi:hypothetical protein
MADGAEDVQPLVCDNGSGMVKVWITKNSMDIWLLILSM